MLRDILGNRETSELIEELNTLFEQLKVLGWREIRPWGEFFGEFKPPEFTSKTIEERVSTNFLHYRSNYAVILCILLLLQVFLSPMLLIAVPLAVIVCCYVLVVHKKPIKIGTTVVTDSHKQTACAIFCLFFFAITGILERLVWIIIYAVFTVGLHMVFRPRNLSAKANLVYEEMKLNGYMSWFGGPSTRSSGVTGAADMSNVDPENPTLKDPEMTSGGAPFAYSSTMSGAGAIDMRKRGHPSSGSGGSLAAAGTARGPASAKND